MNGEITFVKSYYFTIFFETTISKEYFVGIIKMAGDHGTTCNNILVGNMCHS